MLFITGEHSEAVDYISAVSTLLVDEGVSFPCCVDGEQVGLLEKFDLLG